MKKISIVFSALFFVCLNSYSQSSLGTSGKTMTVEEANKLNGVAQPTINGKPYSQYKAEQDALKQQQNKKKTVVSSDIKTVNAADGKSVPAKLQPVEIKPDNGYLKPEAIVPVTKTEVKGTSVKPQVPDQFKLPANTPTWDGKPVPDKTTQTAVQTEQVKLPEIKFVKEDATPKTTNTQTVPAEKTQPSSTDTNLPVKKQN